MDMNRIAFVGSSKEDQRSNLGDIESVTRSHEVVEK